MTTDPVGALRRERSELLTLCRDLSDADWQRQSAAAGWRVQDVVAHMGSAYRALFGPAALELMRSNDIERTNDALVDQRRDWPLTRVIAEYERWSQVMLRLIGPVSRTPLARAPMRLAELGRFRVGQLLCAIVFDTHTHLRHDIAPALGRAVPDSDADRMAVVLEWMMAVLSNQLHAARPEWLDRPVSITLSGPGGGCWVVGADGSVHFGSPSGTVAQIDGVAVQFPEWGTQRASWRDREVTIGGDADYGPVPRRGQRRVNVYDYVVIGAGSAGCAVAARLAAASYTVLLIEAGGSDRRISVRAPLAYGAQVGGPTDWAFESEPEPGCDGRRIPQPRGKVLGGTSAMNAMVWVRGSRLDYDGWQLPGWAWDDVEPVFRRIESGPMRVTRVAEPDEVSRRFVIAARAAGEAANDDVSGPDLDGAAISPVTVWKGQRWSTARAYLDQARGLPNFSLVTGALVRRVVIRDSAAVGVEYERRGRSRTATARHEIVLSAGAYGTPQLLQLSGIGPAEHLRSVGIDPVVDSPRVGHNLTDHPATFMNWDLAAGFIGLADARDPKWLLRWLIRRTGKLTSNLMEAVAHIRSAPGLPAPDFQLIHAPIYARIDEMTYPRPALSILQSYWTPASRGSVMARSPDAAAPPAIQLNTLTAAGDVAAFVRAIRRTREIVSTEPLASAVAAEIHPGPEVRADDELEAWVRATVATTGHPACSAAMGTELDSVLDPQLRVRGVAGLRVADASALPRIPRAKTNAPAIMIGERCADFILRACG